MPYWDYTGDTKKSFDKKHGGWNPITGGGGGNNNNPPPVNIHQGPTAAEIEAEKKRKAAELQQIRMAEYEDFYTKFKGDTKKKTAHLKNYLKKDPLYNTYVNKGLLDWSNIKGFDEDRLKTKEEIEDAKSFAWGYTRPWTEDDSLFIRDVDKFDPTWTPGWTGDSDTERLNKRIAETIGHEARHQVLGEGEGTPWEWQNQTMWTGDPYSQKVENKLTLDENSPYSKYMDEGGLKYEGYSTPMTSHELLTRMGDYQTNNDPRVYDDIYGNVHGWMPRHLTSNVANEFYDASTKFAKDASARTVGEKYENIDPVIIEGYADQLMGDYPEEVGGLPRSEVVRMLKQEAEQFGTKATMDVLKDDYKDEYEYAKGGVARKKYVSGGILDITGDEQITTDEGNDISLVDESENGVSTLFMKKGGPVHRHQLAKKNTDGSRPGYYGPDEGHENDPGHGSNAGGWGPGAGSPGTTSSGGNVNTGGGDQEDDVATMMSNMNITPDHSPNYTGSDAGWVVSEDEETEIGGADYIGPKDKVRIHNEILNRKNKYDSAWEKGKRAVGVYRSFPKPTGVPLVDILSFGYFAYKQNEKKKERIAEIDADLELLDKIGATKHHHSVDTLYQELEQEKLDLTQPKSQKDNDGRDGPTAPVVAPVTEEIEDSYAMAGDWLQGYRDLKAKQALSASLQEKWADERQWQQETLFANSGGLANLFRVKNQ
jgi:hypothetical protein